MQATTTTLGGVDVVVNAAGIMPLAPIVDLEVLDRVYRTYVRGTFVINQHAARRVRRGGAIINFLAHRHPTRDPDLWCVCRR